MRFERCLVHQLRLPFRFRFTHASASRAASDSVLVELATGNRRGFGEAVMREYVGGLLPGPSLAQAAAAAVTPLIDALQGLPWEEARRVFETRTLAPAFRPLFGAVEAARMDLECATRDVDLFQLLGLEPRRSRVRYGAVLPMLPLQDSRALLERIRDVGVASVRIKLGTDLAYNRSALSLSREILGDQVVLRVDVNSAWSAAVAGEHLAACRDHGVELVEDPASLLEMAGIRTDPRAAGITFVADEPFVTETDLATLADGGLYGMANIRLTKNGGLLRSLALARDAASRRLAYCLGCLVGETGILSCLGRSAAALMEEPAFVDGSYDSQLLTDNVTTTSFDFGAGGWAPVIRGPGIGYSVDPKKVRRYSVRSIEIRLSR